MTTLTPEQIYADAIKAGFDKATATVMTAIALAESGGSTTAHNTNAGTGDNSYGLFQINMLGGMGPARRKEFGITNNDQLFDPLTNAKAAMHIYQDQGLKAWSTYSHDSYKKYLNDATAASKTYAPGSADAVKGAQDAMNAGRGTITPASGTEKAVIAAYNANPLSFATHVWDQINDRWFWTRMAFIVGGFIIILIGVAELAKGDTFTPATDATPVTPNNRPSVIKKAATVAE